jgi:hypothetical protein
MSEIPTMIQNLPAVAAEWGLAHVGANDESSCNLREFLIAVPFFVSAVYAPIVHPGLAALMMLAGAMICYRPLLKERCRIRRKDDEVN